MPRRKTGRELTGLPSQVTLLSQRIKVQTATNLHHPAEPQWTHQVDGEEVELIEGHSHRAYGVYDEAQQVITLDDSLGFERARETFLHENIHSWLAVSQCDSIIEDAAMGMSEHVVSALAPVILAWLRDNHEAVDYLREVQA